MAANRKLPFGYRMELGKIVVHPKEAEIVTYIFRQYILGASYKDLVENLRNQDMPYDQGRLWDNRAGRPSLAWRCLNAPVKNAPAR